MTDVASRLPASGPSPPGVPLPQPQAVPGQGVVDDGGGDHRQRLSDAVAVHGHLLVHAAVADRDAGGAALSRGAGHRDLRRSEYPIYTVTIDGVTRHLMLVEPGRESSIFVDPSDPTATQIEWQGRWRTLEQSWRSRPRSRTTRTVWNQLNFPRLLRNTFGIALLSTIGAVFSSILVAYGFARFRFPGRNIFFFILLGTIILPNQVTLLPQYVIFTWLGWNGTWLPLIIPHFFANAFNVFLLRQYFMTIPRDLDEAAMIDGAGPVPDPAHDHRPAVDPGHHGCGPVPLLLRLE